MAQERIVDEQRQLDLFNSILQELNAHGSLDDMVLIGGWTLKMYRLHYGDPRIPSKYTTDADFLFRHPPRVKNSFPLTDYLHQLGFVETTASLTKEMRYQHNLLEIDFLLPHIGSDENSAPVKIPGYGVQATRLRYLDLATKFTIKVEYRGARITVPHPAAYTYLKYIVGDLPSRSKDKAQKDIDTAKQMSEFLRADGKQMTMLHTIMEDCPDPWNEKFYRSLETHNNDFLRTVKDYRAEQFVTRFMLENGIAHSFREQLLYAEAPIEALHFGKHREAIYRKTMEGLPSSHIPFYVNRYLLKDNGDTSVADILKAKNKNRER